MRRISETEENNMYNMLQKSLESLCEIKPDNSLHFLSKKLLEISDGETIALPVKKPKKSLVNRL